MDTALYVVLGVFAYFGLVLLISRCIGAGSK